MTEIRKRLLKRFRDKEYRHAYLDQFLNSLISTQIRTIRDTQGLNQQELSERIESTQSAVSRLENPNYSSWRIDTLRKLAKAFDMALSVRFVSFGDVLTDIERFGLDRLARPEFSKDPVFQESSIDSNVVELESFKQRPLPLYRLPVSTASPFTYSTLYTETTPNLATNG